MLHLTNYRWLDSVITSMLCPGLQFSRLITSSSKNVPTIKFSIVALQHMVVIFMCIDMRVDNSHI
jgi:hypothetical protein